MQGEILKRDAAKSDNFEPKNDNLRVSEELQAQRENCTLHKPFYINGTNQLRHRKAEAEKEADSTSRSGSFHRENAH